MRRRNFIAGLATTAAWPVAARAQQPERVRRIGFLTRSRRAILKIRPGLESGHNACKN